MGQRSQIYLKMENVGKAWAERIELNKPKVWKDRLPEFVEANELYEKWKIMYGEGDTIIVAFHHQWLYGRSFPIVASMLLYASKVFKEDDSKSYFHKSLWKEGHYTGAKDITLDDPHSLIKWLESYMSNIMDQELGPYARNGVEHYAFLSAEHEIEGRLRYDKDFTIGDNNDGVLIVDLITTKYCFIKINGGYDDDEKGTIEENFPYMKPVSALKYIKSYYPECFEDLYEGDTATPEELSNNCEINTKFSKRFNQYEVLTAQELIDMFPDVKDTIEKANNPPAEKKKARKKKV
jgi:hypothetical protein